MYEFILVFNQDCERAYRVSQLPNQDCERAYRVSQLPNNSYTSLDVAGFRAIL